MESQSDKDLEARARFDRIIDFQAALNAGSGSNQSPDPRGQKFDKDLKSGAFKQSGLEEVASGLMENLRRLNGHATLPLSVFNYGRMFQEVYTQICVEHGRSPYEGHFCYQSGDDPPPSNEDLKFFGAVEEGVHKWALGLVSHPSQIGWITNYSHVAGFASIGRQDAQKQIETYAGSLVIQAWTVFESLSEDLWEAALNSHPTVLASLSGKPRSKYKAATQRVPEGRSTDSEARVSFNDLQANAFDVRSKMGTILKDTVSFRSLARIREAYHRAFAKQSKSIDDILDDPGLQYAAAVRNLLIHKRGIVDAEFLKQIASIPNAPALAVKDKFRLTGKLCAELSDSCRSCAVWLVSAVHAWIIGHPA
jgi:hypothetical protein